MKLKAEGHAHVNITDIRFTAIINLCTQKDANKDLMLAVNVSKIDIDIDP